MITSSIAAWVLLASTPFANGFVIPESPSSLSSASSAAVRHSSSSSCLHSSTAGAAEQQRKSWLGWKREPYRMPQKTPCPYPYQQQQQQRLPPQEEKLEEEEPTVDRNTAPLSQLVKVPGFTLAATPEDVLELREGQRMVCLGDVHGDVTGLVKLLKVAGVYSEEQDKWIGDDTILVQCGDVLDRGTEELACYQLLSKLSQQAQAAGGYVICLLGNHEALNAMGLFQYAMGDEEHEDVVGQVVDDTMDGRRWRVQYVQNQPARWASYEPGGLLAADLLQHFKVAVKVGKTVCVHAGLTASHIEAYGGIEGMNAQAKEWISNPYLPNVTYNNMGDYESLRQPWVDAEARQKSYLKSAPACLGGGIGGNTPIWMRDYSSPRDAPPKNPLAQRMMDDVLDMLEADRMVMGHTVQREINAALDGKAWRVDVGVSRGVTSGTPEVLQITNTNGQEVVSILTQNGPIPAEDRQILSMFSFY